MNFVNENRLLQKAKYFFESPKTVFVELAQNAARAGATKLKLSLKDNKLFAIDDGKGCTDPMALLTLAGSDWSEEVEENQNPAGWGLFVLYSISDRVKFISRFGELAVDCNLFLTDSKYREGLLKNVNKHKYFAGFIVQAELKQQIMVHKQYHSFIDKKMLRWFPMEIEYNGESIERKNADTEFCEAPIVTEYMGNKVYINPKRLDSYSSPQHYPFVIWYGIPIEPALFDKMAVVIDVQKGMPLNPVLPYRDRIANDKALQEFQEFVRKNVVGFCIDTINNKKEPDAYNTIILMKILANFALDDNEISSLNKWAVAIEDSYYSNTPDTIDIDYVAIGKDEPPPVNQTLEIYVDGESIDTNGQIVLPEKTVMSVNKLRRSPNWLSIPSEVVKIDITTKGELFSNNYTWQCCEIRCSSDKCKELLAVWIDDMIYYSKEPDNFFEISDAVFATHIYYSDGDDGWETQYNYFDHNVREDVSRISGEYHKQDLLRGFSIAALSTRDIVSITFKNNKAKIRKQGGEMISIKLAA